MLKQFSINHIILIDNAKINLEPGFNVLSGETGSGKSAIMEALNHLLGAKADTNLIRHGEDKGVVEAIFNIDDLPHIKSILENSGIDHIEGEELLIKREISRVGKSRAFINNQSAHISLIKQLGEHLVEIIGQHASQKLLNVDNHRNIVDTFGGLEELRSQYKISWMEENNIRNELGNLIASETSRLKEVEINQATLKELEDANLKAGEDEKLFSEYTRLSHSEELANETSLICEALSEQNVLPALSQILKMFEKLIKLDPALEECRSICQDATAQIKEAVHLLRNYHSKIDCSSERLDEIQARLTLLDKLKKKYGPSMEQVLLSQQRCKENLTRLENADHEIDDLKKKLSQVEEKTNHLAAALSRERRKAADRLKRALLEHLRPLNMPKADFYVEITQHTRNQTGQDAVEFFFTPNLGEQRIPIKECASGGELSRIMLALQTLLAGKESIPTLVFDEIDANVGGETASVVGDKLRQIGSKHQILCITHFPQVAKFATHHLQIYKEERNGRTITCVQALNEASRSKELARMAGGNLNA